VKGLNSGFRGNGSQTTGFYGDAELFSGSYHWDSGAGMDVTLKFGTIVISIKSLEREQQPALLVNWCEVFVLLAFLFHPVLHLVDERYQRARLQGGTRRGFFNDVLCLTKYLLFESWHHLLDFMLDDAIPMALVNSS
jgi:hypothetical protein